MEREKTNFEQFLNIFSFENIFLKLPNNFWKCKEISNIFMKQVGQKKKEIVKEKKRKKIGKNKEKEEKET